MTKHQEHQAERKQGKRGSTGHPSGTEGSDVSIMKRLTQLYNKGPSAYSSVQRLSKYAKDIARADVEQFLQKNNSHTKYRPIKYTFPRLKVLAFSINEIWSIDLADVSKLHAYNDGTKFLLVAVDVLSRYVRVEPLKSKTAANTAKGFAKMIRKKKPEKVWSDKGTEFKGEFKELCHRRGIDMYTTQSKTKSAFAERNIRSLKNIMYKHMEQKWTYSYISHLQEFVTTINSRVNRVTKLAPNKVSKKDVAHLVSLTNTQPSRRARFAVGDTVRIAKEDLPFKKGYKQTFTDELFTITAVPTLNPPTYNLEDHGGETILGKFYEPELSKVRSQ